MWPATLRAARQSGAVPQCGGLGPGWGKELVDVPHFLRDFSALELFCESFDMFPSKSTQSYIANPPFVISVDQHINKTIGCPKVTLCR